MLAKILSFLKKTDGAALIEYALIASLIAIAAIAAMGSLGNKIKDKFNHVDTNLNESATS
jgi:pilus assembly protein Flp/PilA